ncbi:MAG: hypothetical protein JW855_02680 [Gammaproteobacteria bacterium]|nr:hypothetical protein [Gammaproteobacteria bacterium]
MSFSTTKSIQHSENTYNIPTFYSLFGFSSGEGLPRKFAENVLSERFGPLRSPGVRKGVLSPGKTGVWTDTPRRRRGEKICSLMFQRGEAEPEEIVLYSNSFRSWRRKGSGESSKPSEGIPYSTESQKIVTFDLDGSTDSTERDSTQAKLFNGWSAGSYVRELLLLKNIPVEFRERLGRVSASHEISHLGGLGLGGPHERSNLVITSATLNQHLMKPFEVCLLNIKKEWANICHVLSKALNKAKEASLESLPIGDLEKRLEKKKIKSEEVLPRGQEKISIKELEELVEDYSERKIQITVTAELIPVEGEDSYTHVAHQIIYEMKYQDSRLTVTFDALSERGPDRDFKAVLRAMTNKLLLKPEELLEPQERISRKRTCPASPPRKQQRPFGIFDGIGRKSREEEENLLNFLQPPKTPETFNFVF